MFLLFFRHHLSSLYIHVYPLTRSQCSQGSYNINTIYHLYFIDFRKGFFQSPCNIKFKIISLFFCLICHRGKESMCNLQTFCHIENNSDNTDAYYLCYSSELAKGIKLAEHAKDCNHTILYCCSADMDGIWHGDAHYKSIMDPGSRQQS